MTEYRNTHPIDVSVGAVHPDDQAAINALWALLAPEERARIVEDATKHAIRATVGADETWAAVSENTRAILAAAPMAARAAARTQLHQAMFKDLLDTPTTLDRVV